MNYGFAERDIKRGEQVESKDLLFRPTDEQLIEDGNYQALLDINSELRFEIERRSEIIRKQREEINSLRGIMGKAIKTLSCNE